MEDFLHDVSLERRWSVMLLQEASFRRVLDGSNERRSHDMHLVLSMDPHAGQRAGAIIVHNSVAHGYTENSFKQCGRSCSAEIVLDGICVTIISAHLYAKQSQSQYDKSLNDVEKLLNARQKNSEIMIGADVQDCIGSYDETYFPALIGEFAEGPRGAKGRAAVNMFIEKFELVALNTVHPQGDGAMTHWDSRVHGDADCFAPKQIDFVFMSKRRASRSVGSADDSYAACSDHRPVVAAILGNAERKQQTLLNKVKHRGKNQKGWKLLDPLFNGTICYDLGIDADAIDNGDISEFDISTSWFSFSDGSCIDEEGGSKSKYAGWGFAIYGMANALGEGSPILDAARPVVLVKRSKYYVGASRYTSNTGELTAVVECLL
jgi:exonuclease III